MSVQNIGLLDVKLKGKAFVLKLCSAYGEVPAKNPLAVIGSSDFLEVSINQGGVSQLFNIKMGDSICISPFSGDTRQTQI